MNIQFLDDHGGFRLENAENTSYLYYPLASRQGLRSAVTPNLGGDAKLSQESFLLEPVSAENLHNNRSVRNVWCRLEDGSVWSAVGASAQQDARKFTSEQDQSAVSAGFMRHTLERRSERLGLASFITMVVPTEDNVELMLVRIENQAAEARSLTVYGALPIYGRSADNLRDHRNVTSMLHRIETKPWGVAVKPTMSFDERGHQRNERIYYAAGFTADGTVPEAFYPTVEDFLGEGGSYTRPRAVYEAQNGVGAEHKAAGKEAMGAFRFPAITLNPGESAEYVLLLGAEDSPEAVKTVLERYRTAGQVRKAAEEAEAYWQEQVNVAFHTGDADFDRLMKWVSFQPFLRRLFGCSFLPHHDYGRGGRGWRDLWQDCLSLLLMAPGDVGKMLEKNFGGVRIDGTNATIIGEGDGSFIADRNGIARVWMDHALWPQITTLLYLDQTGDLALLERTAPYFKDAQACRGTTLDQRWRAEDGCWQRTADGEIYQGTILEHLVVELLTAFYEVGEHNICRLRGADWNDALDMAPNRGESVAFTCAYAGNLTNLAALLERISEEYPTVELLEELSPLLCGDEAVFENPVTRCGMLHLYTQEVAHAVSGKRLSIPTKELADNLRRKADWLGRFLRRQEWLDAGNGEGWFNGYYDDHGRRVEGVFPSGVRMMLTAQVFAVMGGVATDEQIASIVRSADRYLYREEIGGYRLNTDFHELKLDLGRMFGFAYGEKENGGVFSHMAVMYANALYRRGCAAQGWKALHALAENALNFSRSRIYPGIPEYFRSDGRGMYHYLTGAASWYLLTMLTEVFGVRGQAGDLVLEPKLLPEQFDEAGTASVCLTFAGRELEVVYHNPQRLDYGHYQLAAASCNGEALEKRGNTAVLSRARLSALPKGRTLITVTLSER